MSRSAMMNDSGANTLPHGTAYGRFASGTCRRKAPRESGAPAYIITLARVIRVTSECQLGNGSRKNRPTTNANRTPTQGTPLALVRAKIVGKYRFLARP